MRDQFILILISIISMLFGSCHSVEEPRPEVGLGWHLDEKELEAIHILYDSLHLQERKEYRDWVTNDCVPGMFYSDLQDIYVTKRHGLTFGVDSLTNHFVVTEMKLDNLPNRDDVCLPNVFDKFKHLKKFTLNIPPKASIALPPSLCDCPLETLHIMPHGKNGPFGSMPANFGNLASTLKSLKLTESQYGNDLLYLIPEFTQLKYANLSSNNFTGEVPDLTHLEYANLSWNNFTGKIPYFPNCNTEFYFNGNNFTEFDWRYLEDYPTFLEAYYSKKEILLIPCFKYNKIDGTLPPYFNEGFFELYKKDMTRVELFLGRIFGYNPLYNVFGDTLYKYLGWRTTLFAYAEDR